MRMKKAIALLGLLTVMVAGPALSANAHGHQRHNPPAHHHKGFHRARPAWNNRWYSPVSRWPGYVYYRPVSCYPIVYEPQPVYQLPWNYYRPWCR